MGVANIRGPPYEIGNTKAQFLLKCKAKVLVGKHLKLK
jgi:hypothetical protein